MLGWNHFSLALCAKDSAAGTYFHPAQFSLLEGIASFSGQNSVDLANETRLITSHSHLRRVS